MSDPDKSTLRPHRSLRDDLALALLPTGTILIVLALVEAWSRQRLLFASLAASVFLIYLDPEHETNNFRTLVVAQGAAALIGFASRFFFGPSYLAAGGAMVVAIFGMILLRLMHPPAVATTLSFALGPEAWRALALFGVCILLIAVLIFLQRAALSLLTQSRAGRKGEG